MSDKTMTTETASPRMGVPLWRFVRRFPVDWNAIAEESGCTRGTLCFHNTLGWGVMSGNGGADFCCITPPRVAEGERLRIEGNEWAVYAPNTPAHEPRKETNENT